MATQEELLAAHEIKGPLSCVSWGYEFIAKWQEQMPLNDFSIQSERPSGMGFTAQDQQWFHARYPAIATERREFLINDLESVIKAEAGKNNPLILRLFSRATVHYGTQTCGISRDYHIFVGFAAEGRAYLATRGFEDDQVVYLRWSWAKEIHGYSAALPKHEPMIACLLHRLVP